MRVVQPVHYGGEVPLALAAIFHRAVHQTAAKDYSPEQLAAWAPGTPDLESWRKRLEATNLFLCERSGEIAGFLAIDGAGYIDLLYVDPPAQRQGVARALMAHAISWARERGIGRLESDVSITARPFFERMGFRMVRENRVVRRGVSFTNFRMERDTGNGT